MIYSGFVLLAVEWLFWMFPPLAGDILVQTDGITFNELHRYRWTIQKRAVVYCFNLLDEATLPGLHPPS